MQHKDYFLKSPQYFPNAKSSVWISKLQQTAMEIPLHLGPQVNEH